MIVQVKLFAVARQLTQTDAVQISLSDGATVGALRRELARQVPSLVPLIPHLMIAVDTQYADDDLCLRGGEEVACIPPVSGG